LDFIEDYSNFILQHVPATNPDWAESVAINVLNAVVGSKIHIWTEIGRLYTNLFFLNIGRARERETGG